MDNIKIIAIFSFISLVVTVILNYFFQNTAFFTSVDKTVSLGGAVAFFFIFFSAEMLAYNSINYDVLIDLRKKISGNWKYTGKMSGVNGSPPTKFNGVICIQTVHGKISVTGEDEGEGEELWEADEVILKETKLIYFFDVTGLNIRGVTDLNFINSKEREISEMKGSWDLVGQAGKGNVTLTRID